MEKVNLEAVTIEDCIDMYQKKNKCVILNDGKIIEFSEDK